MTTSYAFAAGEGRMLATASSYTGAGKKYHARSMAKKTMDARNGIAANAGHG
jgi:hypothetical protein